MLVEKKTIRNECIICFSGADWWYHNPYSKNHIMKRFAKQNKVMFVNSIGIRFPSLSDDAFCSRILNKVKSLLKWTRWAEPNLLVLSPLAIPFYSYRAVRWINKYLLILQLRLAMILFGYRKPILWIGMPSVAELVGHLDEKLLIYHCSDKFTAYEGAPTIIERMEKKLFEKSDLVFFAGKKLYQDMRHLNDNSHLIRHAVDFDHFAAAMQNSKPSPEDMRGIKRPIIGYFGEINYASVDKELIEYVATKHPAWSFVFLGHVKTDISRFDNCDNVHFPGQKTYSELPDYARMFDVCIIPYVVEHEYDIHRSPIKLREYLATGRPVVSVSLPEMDQFNDLVHIAENYEDFSVLLAESIDCDSKEMQNKRIEAVRNETWDERFSEISELIKDKLA